MLIANRFWESLDIQAKPEDIIFTGSMAAYNWTDTSDIDLHVVLDYKQIDGGGKLVKDYLMAKKGIWNDKHHITLRGVPVELYAQDTREPHYAPGIYSLMQDKWLKEPTKDKPQVVDEQAVSKKAEYLKYEIDQAIAAQDLTKLQAISEKIRQMRATGLAQGGEWSTENQAFKDLRRTGYMEKLTKSKLEISDTQMSLANKQRKSDMELKNRYTAQELHDLPTLEQGHFSNLKLVSPNRRIWLSRLTKEDGQQFDHAVEEELLVDGNWVLGPIYDGGPISELDATGSKTENQEHTDKAKTKEQKMSAIKVNGGKLEEVLDKAQGAFWDVVAASYPEAKTGDFDPPSSAKFDKACKEAISIWVSYNVPGQVAEASKKTADYQGWKNYETWAVALWVDNEESTQNMVLEWVDELRGTESEQVKEGIWTADEALRFNLAERLKEWVEENNPVASEASMYSDLMGAAISEVDWQEVADHYIGKDQEITKSKASKTAAPKKPDKTTKEPAKDQVVVAFDEDGVKSEMAEALEAEAEDLQVREDGEAFVVKDGNAEYRVVENEDVAENLALAQVREALESDPSMFNRDFIKSHISFSPTDCRLMAQDLVGDYYQEMKDRDVEREYETKIDSELPKDADGDSDYEAMREQLTTNMEEEYEQALKDDPYPFLVEDQGLYTDEDFFKQHGQNIDIEAAAKEAVSMDGWAHFISRHDGDYATTGAGFVYWRE